MPRVNIAHADESPVVPFPDLPGISPDGSIRTKEIFRGEPLALWIHELQPGTCLQWDRPPVGHAIYVVAGEAVAASTSVGTGGAVIIEHRARGSIRAGDGGVRLAHFHRLDCDEAARSGGHTHIVGPRGVAHVNTGDGRSYTLLADANCPTCELWLHRAQDMPPGYLAKPHKHTSDEIIFILQGAMRVGRKELTAGSALSIHRDTAYSFSSGPEGLGFLNFRDREPFYIAVTRDGTDPQPINERELILNGVFFGKQIAE